MSNPELKAVASGDLSSPTIPDPFDLDSLSLSQAFMETAGVKKHINTIPVRRPYSQDFVRVHASADYRRNLLCIDLKDDRETYVVRPEIAVSLIVVLALG